MNIIVHELRTKLPSDKNQSSLIILKKIGTMKKVLSWEGGGFLSAVRSVDFCIATTKHCYLNRSKTIPYILYFR